MNDRSRLPLARLLIVGVLVPAIFSAVDHWLLTALQVQNYSTSRAAFTMGAFVVQVGLLGWLCGRFVENPWWRWGLYLWGWILIDVQLLAASTYFDRDQLPRALLLAQASLAMIWAIMGTTHWAIRIPACAVLGMLVTVPLLEDRYGLRIELILVQLISLAAICLLLRSRRFRLARIAGPHVAQADSPAGASDQLGLMQFSIRHVLIWTTSLAVLLGILKALDLLSLRALAPFFRPDFIAVATAGILIACAFIVAMWAAVGHGPIWLRLPVLAVSVPVIGLSLSASRWYTHNATYGSLTLREMLTTSYVRDEFWEHHTILTVWIILASSLLFASLLILQVIGYRLVRRVSKSQATRPLAAAIESPATQLG